MAAMLSDEALDKPPVKVPNKHIIPADSILVNKELGTGEFGVVQQGVWTNEGERVSNTVCRQNLSEQGVREICVGGWVKY